MPGHGRCDISKSPIFLYFDTFDSYDVSKVRTYRKFGISIYRHFLYLRYVERPIFIYTFSIRTIYRKSDVSIRIDTFDTYNSSPIFL